MALARCDDHQPEPVGEDYASYTMPLGYPDTLVTCEVLGCFNPARIWLTEGERAAFLAGTRSFHAHRADVRVSDDLFPD